MWGSENVGSGFTHQRNTDWTDSWRTDRVKGNGGFFGFLSVSLSFPILSSLPRLGPCFLRASRISRRTDVSTHVPSHIELTSLKSNGAAQHPSDEKE
jgi:hypothetical protein